MKKLILLLLLLSITSLSCRPSQPEVLSFNSKFNLDKLSKLDGKSVTISGFLASVDTDGTTGYLVPKPYSTHLDFDENATEIVDCIMFVMPDGLTYDITDLPITVTGKLRIDKYTDAMQYTAHIYIQNAVVKSYSSKDITAVTVYAELAKNQFVQSFDTYMSDIYTVTNYKELEEDPTPLDENLFGDLYALVESHTEEPYKTPKQLIVDGMSLTKDVNDTIAQGDMETLGDLSERGQKLYDDFYAWLKSISF